MLCIGHAGTITTAPKNPIYRRLFGEVDLIAKKRHTQCTFKYVVEIVARGVFHVHLDVAIDLILEGQPPKPLILSLDDFNKTASANQPDNKPGTLEDHRATEEPSLAQMLENHKKQLEGDG